MTDITNDTVLYYYTNYTLSDDNNYSVDASIDDVSVVMYFGYNSRLGKRWISVETTTGTVLLERTFLDIGREVKFNINAELLGINEATLMLYPTNENGDTDFLNWSKNYRILIWGIYSYLYEDYRRKLVTDYVS